MWKKSAEPHQRPADGNAPGTDHQADHGRAGAVGGRGLLGAQQAAAGPDQPGADRCQEKVSAQGCRGHRNLCGLHGCGLSGRRSQRGQNGQTVVEQVYQHGIQQIAAAQGGPGNGDPQDGGGQKAHRVQVKCPEQHSTQHHPAPDRHGLHVVEQIPPEQHFFTERRCHSHQQIPHRKRNLVEQVGDAGAYLGQLLGNKKHGEH